MQAAAKIHMKPPEGTPHERIYICQQAYPTHSILKLYEFLMASATRRVLDRKTGLRR
jgi:hypothetical protein